MSELEGFHTGVNMPWILPPSDIPAQTSGSDEHINPWSLLIPRKGVNFNNIQDLALLARYLPISNAAIKLGIICASTPTNITLFARTPECGVAEEYLPLLGWRNVEEEKSVQPCLLPWELLIAIVREYGRKGLKACRSVEKVDRINGIVVVPDGGACFVFPMGGLRRLLQLMGPTFNVQRQVYVTAGIPYQIPTWRARVFEKIEAGREASISKTQQPMENPRSADIKYMRACISRIGLVARTRRNPALKRIVMNRSGSNLWGMVAGGKQAAPGFGDLGHIVIGDDSVSPYSELAGFHMDVDTPWILLFSDSPEKTSGSDEHINSSSPNARKGVNFDIQDP
ncbi:hypothetical protein BD779DRAFT_1477341 [Infundibulicybe gibba]|nr:hypothetical protein BD779DRAFT_1477341 [Infundibulicybe gibba]